MIYEIDFDQLSGFIQTDGALGTLNNSDITAFSVAWTPIGNYYNYSGANPLTIVWDSGYAVVPVNGVFLTVTLGGSFFYLWGGLIATPTQLIVDYTQSGSGFSITGPDDSAMISLIWAAHPSVTPFNVPQTKGYQFLCDVLGPVYASLDVYPTGQVPLALEPLSGQVALSTVTEGVTTTRPIATFTDTNITDTASGFTAIINVGDGTTEAGTITRANGSFARYGA